ncbi:hypothetical protein [Psychromonas ossibalaenae]|uniref:hypothetical protein n=1 Tax=Psychromonas ossibalaenae TaxID=444922 RepID=UPI00035FEACC|nr:hypothetical protein [Psychromonas ossibalaenae]
MINCNDFISSAQFRPEDKLTEIDYRNSASRAYYGAYHACTQLACHFELLNEEPNHAIVIKALRNSDNKNHKELSTLLHQCKVKRQNADYRLQRTFTPQEAKKQLRTTKAIIRQVESELAEKIA